MTGRLDELRSVAFGLAARCPDDLGRETAITGSAGAGLVDEHSDLEMLFLVDEPPSLPRVRAWLEELDATDVCLGGEPSGVWAWARVDGVEFEPYWGAVDDAHAEVAAITRGEAIEHRRLAFAHVLAHAVVVRTDGVFPELMERVAVYPDALRALLIRDAVAGLEIPSARFGGAVRGDRLSTQVRRLNEAQRVLRVVFAVNKRWEPPRWKWLEHYAAALETSPPRLAARVVDALLDPDPLGGREAMLELLAEALALVPGDIDVDAARLGLARQLAQLADVRPAVGGRA